MAVGVHTQVLPIIGLRIGIFAQGAAECLHLECPHQCQGDATLVSGHYLVLLKSFINYEPRFGKLMKNKKEISSSNGFQANGQSYLIQAFCPYRDRQQGLYQKAFLTAKFAKKSQRPQRVIRYL